MLTMRFFKRGMLMQQLKTREEKITFKKHMISITFWFENVLFCNHCYWNVISYSKKHEYTTDWNIDTCYRKYYLRLIF